jgi:hypothetical protein
LATKEREIVHTKKLDEFDEVTVTQDLDTGNVRVEYQGSTNMGEAPIQLDYKAGEVVEDASRKAGKEIKTKSEFSAVESEPEIVNWDGDIEWTGENVVGKVDDLLTDTTKLETYATGKNPNIKKLLKSEQKQKYVNKLHDDTMEQVEYIENKGGEYMPVEDILDEGARVGDFDPKGYRNLDTKGMNLPERKIKKASGGRVPLKKGKVPRGPNEWLQLLDEDWDYWDPYDLEKFLMSMGITPKAEGGRVPVAGGGIMGRVPYWGGRTYKLIKEALKMNKIFGIGGPPYKPGLTSLDMKQLTKDKFGTEFSLADIKKTAKDKDPSAFLGQWRGMEEDLPKFLQEFKGYKSEVIKAYLMESKQKAELGIKVAKDMRKSLPEGLDPEMTNKVTQQMIKKDTQRLKDIDEALKEIDVYKATVEKKGVTAHASGGRVPFGVGELVKPKNWKLFKEFVEKLFIKSSNDIRLNRGIFKGLTEEQRIVQHDNLTQLSEKFRKTGEFDKGANQYFGIDAEEAFAKVEAKVVQPHGLSQKEMLRKKYEGKIDDNLLNQILIDDNPARIAEVTATIDEALIMQHKGMGPETIMQTFKDAWKRKKQASGGLAGMLGE